MSAKHTPGPWKSVRFQVITGTGKIRRVADTSDITAEINGGTPEEDIANAHLIAAAPEMYEALEAALPILEDDLDGCFDPDCLACGAIKKVRAALRKAKGGAE